MKKILFLFLVFSSHYIYGQTNGCLVIEDIGSGLPDKTRLIAGPTSSTQSTTCYGFGNTVFSNLPVYTGSPRTINSSKCTWEGSSTNMPSCLYKPVMGDWICGRIGTFKVECPIDDNALYFTFALASIGFIFIRRKIAAA